MKIEHINNNLSISGQIAVDDIQALADIGVQVIVCNRPDGEAIGQPLFSELQLAADQLGVETVLIDFAPGKITKKNDRRVYRNAGNK